MNGNNANTTIRKYSWRELSFEWSHLQAIRDSSGFRSVLGLAIFTFGSDRVKIVRF